MAKLQFLPSLLAGNFVVLLGILLLTFVFGRLYCSVICPMGVFQDIIIFLRRKFTKKRFKFNKERRFLRSFFAGLALIGIIIASLVNFFMHSARLDYIISIIGVLIFTGLTAFDVQKIKQIGNAGINDGEIMAKITIHAALTLYLDFINLFLYLLRFFGNRD